MLLTGEGDDACVVTHVQIGSHNSGSWLSHSRRGASSNIRPHCQPTHPALNLQHYRKLYTTIPTQIYELTRHTSPTNFPHLALLVCIPTSSHRRSLSRGRRSSLLPPSLAPPSHTFLSFTHPILLACLLLSCSEKHRIYVGFSQPQY